jgi:uncharacterized protein (TIGR03435 family)
MRIAEVSILPMTLVALTAHGLVQTPPPHTPGGRTFATVSIKRSVDGSIDFTSSQRTDGGFVTTNTPISTLITRAYAPAIPNEMIGLPGWATTERYDISATSSLSRPTPDESIAMLRAMLADRFKLSVHIEKREQAIYELVRVRSDGTLGPGIAPTEIDCAPRVAADRVEAEDAGTRRPVSRDRDQGAPAPRCVLRMVDDVLEGDTTLPNFARMLRTFTGREVIDKTGLTGFYHVNMNFDTVGARRPPSFEPQSSVFATLQERLGMKLQPSRAEVDRLVIDRLERPSED